MLCKFEISECSVITMGADDCSCNQKFQIELSK